MAVASDLESSKDAVNFGGLGLHLQVSRAWSGVGFSRGLGVG